MFDAVDRAEVLLAWLEPPPFRELDLRARDEPDLRLLLISDDGAVLFVEVEEGTPFPSGTMLWVEGRGSFEVAGVLSRESAGSSRSYMRLRLSRLPPVAA